MVRSLLVSLALIVGLAHPAAAGDVAYPKGKVSFWLPDDWRNNGGSDDQAAMLVTRSPSGDAGFMFTVTDAKDLAKAKKGIDKLLAPIVTGATLGKPKKAKLNKMKAMTWAGTGKVGDKDVSILVLLVQTPAKKVVLGVGLAETATYDANKATLAKIVAGIKPLK